MKLKRKIIIDIKQNYAEDIKGLSSNLKISLNNMEFRTIIEPNIIKFDKIFKSTTHSGQNKREALNFLRHGVITFSQLSENKIKITYFVLLDGIIFMSILSGFLSGFFISLFTNLEILTSGLTGAIIAIIIFIIGYITFWVKMNELIRLCIYD